MGPHATTVSTHCRCTQSCLADPAEKTGCVRALEPGCGIAHLDAGTEGAAGECRIALPQCIKRTAGPKRKLNPFPALRWVSLARSDQFAALPMVSGGRTRVRLRRRRNLGSVASSGHRCRNWLRSSCWSRVRAGRIHGRSRCGILCPQRNRRPKGQNRCAAQKEILKQSSRGRKSVHSIHHRRGKK